MLSSSGCGQQWQHCCILVGGFIRQAPRLPYLTSLLDFQPLLTQQLPQRRPSSRPIRHQAGATSPSPCRPQAHPPPQHNRPCQQPRLLLGLLLLLLAQLLPSWQLPHQQAAQCRAGCPSLPGGHPGLRPPWQHPCPSSSSSCCQLQHIADGQSQRQVGSRSIEPAKLSCSRLLLQLQLTQESTSTTHWTAQHCGSLATLV